MDNITQKYEYNVLKYLNKDNIDKILKFLEEEKCSFVEDLMEDYLDIFLFEYEEFKSKYNQLNIKYPSFLERCSQDMNLLEEFYNV